MNAMRVISNTSPISNLCVIGHIGLLSELYGNVIIPDRVYQELQTSPRIAPLAKAAEEAGILSISSDYDHRVYQLLRHTLDAGESAAIALMLNQPASSLLLMDERLGRQAAKQANIKVMGVLGVLSEAKRRGLIATIAPCINDLITIANFRIAPALKRAVLQEAGETDDMK